MSKSISTTFLKKEYITKYTDIHNNVDYINSLNNNKSFDSYLSCEPFQK